MGWHSCPQLNPTTTATLTRQQKSALFQSSGLSINTAVRCEAVDDWLAARFSMWRWGLQETKYGLFRTHSTSSWVTRCGGPGAAMNRVSPAARLVQPMGSSVLLIIPIVTLEFCPIQAPFNEQTFAQASTYSYFCALHCFAGMTGVINVAPHVRPHPTPRPRPIPHPRPVPPG